MPAAEPITADQLRLTPLTVGDAPTMHRVLADPSLYRFTGGSPPSLEQLERRYRAQCDGSPDPEVSWRNWIVRSSDDGRALGYVQATITGDGAVVAWLIGAPWQRRGFATEAATAMCAWLTAKGTRRLDAHIHPEHHASARIARTLGMRPSGDVDDDGERIWTTPTHARGWIPPDPPAP